MEAERASTGELHSSVIPKMPSGWQRRKPFPVANTQVLLPRYIMDDCREKPSKFIWNRELVSKNVFYNISESHFHMLLGTALPGFRSCNPPMAKAEQRDLGP